MSRMIGKGVVSALSLLLLLVCGMSAQAATPQVSASGSHTVALKSDGTVWTWGKNSEGQLGNGTTANSAMPTQVSGIDGMVAVAAGSAHTLALKNDGTLWAWGRNNFGQLGDGTTDLRTTPVQVSGLTGVVSIAAGINHNLALKGDGTVWAWGRNDAGQLGDVTSSMKTMPYEVGGLSGVIAVSAGTSHSMALTNDGTVWAWGSNTYGQLGDGTTTNRWMPDQVSGLSAIVSVVAGTHQNVALKSDGTVWAWGNNGSGQLGDGTTTNRLMPVQVSSLAGVVSVAAGYLHTLAVTADGTLWAWGDNGSGRLGDGTTVARMTPVPVSGLTSVSAVAAGYYHTVALKGDGTVWSWGNNDDGQLGEGSFTSKGAPVQVGGLSAVAAAGGSSHTVVVKGDGTVWTWGNNSDGQLGNGTTTQGITPAQVSGLNDVIATTANFYHTVVVKSDGTVWSWGGNLYGVLGNGTTTPSTTPVQASGLTGVVAVAAGGYHTVALKSDGTVWAWGHNYFGQVGDGTVTSRSTPVQVSSLTGVIAIAAGAHHSVALKNDGTVWAWGYNAQGMLGDGTNTGRLTPVQVSGLTGVTAVAAGTYHTAAVKGDGTVWAWGLNEDRQLGVEPIDYTNISKTPVQASGVSGAVAVTAGRFHTIALKSDGTLWAWGGNTHGELGNGTFISSTTAVQVLGLSDVVVVAAGSLHTVALTGEDSAWVWGSNQSGQLGIGPSWAPRLSLINLGAVEQVVHTVIPSAEAGGSLSPAVVQVLGHGSTTSFAVIPDSGYEINSIAGCGGALVGDTFITGPILADCTVSATFAPISHTLGITVAGSGTVHSTPGSDIACSGGCSLAYAEETMVTLSAEPASGYDFISWAGACSGSGTCQVMMDAAKIVTAVFQTTPILECLAPASLTVPAANTNGVITVSWGASATEGVTYKLERSLNGGAFSVVYSGTALSYTANNLANGSHVFRVKATRSGYLDSTYQTVAPCVVTLTADAPPTMNVPATDFDGSFVINWSASPTTAVSYVLELAIGTGEFSELYRGTNRSYSFSGLENGSYLFRLKAVKNGYVDSTYQTATPCVVTLTVVEAPGALSVPATDTDGTFMVSWTASATAGVTYKLECSHDGEASFTQVYSGTSTKYTASNLVNGSYVYRVKAVKSGYVDSAPQEATCVVMLTAVTAPASLAVPAADTDGAFTVSWGASATEGVINKLERSLNGGTFFQVYSGTAQSYTVSGLTDGSYTFRVKAVKSGYLDSAPREATCVVTLAAVAAPASITAPATDTDGAYLVSWEGPATEGVSYKLERATNGGVFLQVYSGTDLSYAVSSQSNGSYVYRVKTVKDGFVDSTYQTGTACVVTLTAEPPAAIIVPATSTAGSVPVNWMASTTTGVSYKLERSDDDGATFAQIYSGTALSYPVNGLNNGSYLFRVKAVKAGFADSAYQTATPCVVTLAVAAAPSLFTVPATDTDGSFTINWDASTTAGVTYKLERSDDNEMIFTEIYSGTGRTYTASGLATGNYTFRVKAVKSGFTDSAWQSETCAVTVTAVEAPALLTVPVTDTDGSFTVSWGSSATLGVTYKLESSVNSGPFTLQYSGTALAYVASGLTDGSYTFRVKAVKSGFVDSIPQEAPCLVTLTEVNAPASFTVPATSMTGSVTVNWAASPTAGASYRLERSNGGAFTQVYSGTDLTYTANGLSTGSYTFRVKAVKDGFVDSQYQSGICEVTISAVEMPASITVPATNSDGAFTVSWETSATDGVTYKLERSLNGGIFTQVYSGTVLSYTTSGLTTGSYTFRVKAVKSGYPDSDYQTAAVPCVVALTAGMPPSLNVPATDFDGSFGVNWTTSATPGVIYKLERSDDGGVTFTEVYSGTARSYAANGLASGSYLFRVKAVKSGYLDSSYQTAAVCMVVLTAVGTPPSITVPATDADGSFMVKWEASAMAGVTYKLERSSDNGVTYTQVYSGTSKAYSVSGLTGGSYLFRVKAVKSGYLNSAYTTSGTCVVVP